MYTLLKCHQHFCSIQQPLMYHNGQLMQSSNAGVFTVEHKSTFVVDVTRDSTVTLAIKQVHKYLTLTLTVPVSACSNQQSVFGDCAEAASSSVDETGEIWRVTTEDSHFGVLDTATSPMGRSDVSVGGGYALRFDSKTWMATDVLVDVFRYMQDTSIELFVKPESTSGLVVSVWNTQHIQRIPGHHCTCAGLKAGARYRDRIDTLNVE